MRAANVIFIAILLTGCGGPPVESSYQGYVEGEFVQVGSPLGGTLESLSVARGQNVAAGAPLFALERATETAAVAQAEAQLKAAQARLANLGQGRRLPELNALQASVDSAGAALRLSTLQLAQQEKLAQSGFISDTALAATRAAKERDSAQLANATAQLATAQLSLGRDAELAAALADSDAARAALDQAKSRLAQKVLVAPAAARVQDTFFTVGEWVPPASPVVNLLPPGNVTLRFFVPETVVATVKSGQQVSVSCDACGAAINAKVSYVSSQAEYTPPVIYGRDSRAKLVYLIEARPDGDAGLRLTPGQPVDVRLKPP
jgi:HlyD family secretion protein